MAFYIVFTGKLSQTRNYHKEKIDELNHLINSSFQSNYCTLTVYDTASDIYHADCVILGKFLGEKKSSTKLEAAKRYGKIILNEEQYLYFLECLICFINNNKDCSRPFTRTDILNLFQQALLLDSKKPEIELVWL
jgi:hypothetical protein